MNPDKVCVSIRMRPLIPREQDTEAKINWICNDNTVQMHAPTGDHRHKQCGQSYSFDHVFGPTVLSHEVYQDAISPFVKKSFEGYNCTVLCYGQTSSGKPHTLYGDHHEEGIIALATNHLFVLIGQESAQNYRLRLGFLEIYNQSVTDLLNNGVVVEIRENNGAIYPAEFLEIETACRKDVVAAVRKVQAIRRTGRTQMNSESSRSHVILRMRIECADVGQHQNGDMEGPLNSQTIRNSVLNFVDLSGSEKACQTGEVGNRFREATCINKSLLALSKVVSQLSKSSSAAPISRRFCDCNSDTFSCKHSALATPFISYRDSKLTRLLQDSLSGNSYISLICNVTPASVDETHSTLEFAKGAKCIKVNPAKPQALSTGAQHLGKIMELEMLLRKKMLEAESLKRVALNMQTSSYIKRSGIKCMERFRRKSFSEFTSESDTALCEKSRCTNNQIKASVVLPTKQLNPSPIESSTQTELFYALKKPASSPRSLESTYEGILSETAHSSIIWEGWSREDSFVESEPSALQDEETDDVLGRVDEINKSIVAQLTALSEKIYEVISANKFAPYENISSQVGGIAFDKHLDSDSISLGLVTGRNPKRLRDLVSPAPHAAASKQLKEHQNACHVLKVERNMALQGKEDLLFKLKKEMHQRRNQSRREERAIWNLSKLVWKSQQSCDFSGSVLQN